MVNDTTSASSSPVKDAIDANSGRFEFLKQTLTLGLAGIAGVAALFTDPTRIPADTVSKWAILGGAIGLGGVVLFAIMGLSSYANLLTATASSDAVVRKCAPTYAKGVRDHARVVVLALTVAFIGIGFFACYRLLLAPTTGTPESAIEMAAALISKETKQPPDRLYLMRMEADDDAFTVTYQVAATSSEATVRVSKKDGSVIRLTQQKKP